MKSFRDLREKTLTPAEKKKREEIAKSIEKDDPDMPMDKKMAIATATAKRVAEEVELDEAKESGMDVARRIVKNKQHEKGVDMTTANFILQIYDKVKPENKKKMDTQSIKQLASMATQILSKTR